MFPRAFFGVLGWLIVFAAPVQAKLSPLAPEPDWFSLEKYQRSVTRSEFEAAVRGLYSLDGSFFQYLDIKPERVTVYGDKKKTKPLWTLHFAAKKSQHNPRHRFPPHLTRSLRQATPEQPLKGLTICLDPGHIGGKWARVEERFFRVRKKDPPVQEGDLTLLTAQRLAPLLEQAGARVVWTKQSAEPVTSLRPDDLLAEAVLFFFKHNKKVRRMRHRYRKTYLKHLQRTADLLFYRAGEIRARARRVNEELKPDFTIALHYNAYPSRWRRRLYNKTNYLIVFVHGSYSAKELEYDNHKFRLMAKLLEKSSSREIAIAESIANAMKTKWGWPAQGFDPKLANRVSPNPYVWTRNLLANRLYNGPVVFVEGPFMNHRAIYHRLIAGDYDGEKKIRGKKYRSVFREYAEAVANGVTAYYAQSK